MKTKILSILFTLFLFNFINAQNIKIGNLEVTSTDLIIPELQAKGMDPKYDYNNHVIYYLEEHPEWRLPTLEEMIYLYENREKLNMKESFYMAYSVNPGSKQSEKYQNEASFVKFFESGKYNLCLGQRCSVRLIKVKK
jgi:hypothetical protein